MHCPHAKDTLEEGEKTARKEPRDQETAAGPMTPVWEEGVSKGRAVKRYFHLRVQMTSWEKPMFSVWIDDGGGLTYTVNMVYYQLVNKETNLVGSQVEYS